MERDGDTSNIIAGEFSGRRYEKAILAEIEKQAVFAINKGNEDGRMRGDAWIKAAFGGGN